MPGAHRAVHPPSITSIEPVMYEDALCDARNKIAALYSSTRAIRPRIVRLLYSSTNSGGWLLNTPPGTRVFTRTETHRARQYSASPRGKFKTPDFAPL